MPITRIVQNTDGFHSGYFFNCDYASPLPERRVTSTVLYSKKKNSPRTKPRALDAEVLSMAKQPFIQIKRAMETTWNGHGGNLNWVRETDAVRPELPAGN